jgi:hypothetical protein
MLSHCCLGSILASNVGAATKQFQDGYSLQAEFEMTDKLEREP